MMRMGGRYRPELPLPLVKSWSEDVPSTRKSLEATLSNEQAQSVGQVMQGLQQIDAVTQQNTAHAEETAGVSSEMSTQAKKLQQLVGQFRLR